jgi:hypothetical protein
MVTLIAVGSANAVNCTAAKFAKGYWGVQLTGFDASGNETAQLLIIKVVPGKTTSGTIARGNWNFGVSGYPTGYYSDNGNPVAVTDIVGTYTIVPQLVYQALPSCVGTMQLTLTLSVGGPITEDLSFVLNKGVGGYLSSIDPAVANRGFMQATGENGTTTTCTPALVVSPAGGYVSFHSGGPLATVGNTTGEGQLQLGLAAGAPVPTGAEAGNLQLWLGGFVLDYNSPGPGANAAAGTYTISPDCTGTSFLGVIAIPSIFYDSYTVTVAKGKEALFIITDPGNTIVGNTLY